MITPKEIKDKAERKYISFLETLVENKPFEKLVIRGDKSYSKSSLSEFEKEIQQIISQSKEKKGFGYTLEFQQVKTKSLGMQDLPTSIYFDTERDFLKFLGKDKEVELYLVSVERILEKFPELKGWVFKNSIKIIQNQAEWESILNVCEYFRENPKPNLYIRELPINVHTKFVERNQALIKNLLDVLISEHLNNDEKQFEKRFNLKYSEPQIRFKILDKEISQIYFSGLDDLAIPVSQFETFNLPIKKVLVVENKTTLYTATTFLALPKMEKTIAIFGSGYSVANLRNVKWFKNVELLYWGDIDVQGFEILSQFRGYFPSVKSVLMDKKTFDCFFENDEGIQSKIITDLNLSKEEYELYNILKQNNWRLEQEKISISYANEIFLAKMSKV